MPRVIVLWTIVVAAGRGNDVDMSTIPAAAVAAAAEKLRGHLVQSPLIGSIMLGGDGRIDVRWKADMVQPGGSGWFRGFQHLLLRSYGALPGLVFAGDPAQVLAAALAARQHRLPFVAYVGVSLSAALASAIVAVGGSVEVVADPAAAAARLQRSKGYLPLPGAEHPEVAAGLATAGLELGLGLPADCAAVYALASAVAALTAGLAAAGRALPIVGVDGERAEPAAVQRVRMAVAFAHRLDISDGGAAVLLAAMQHPGGGPVGALLLD